MLRAAIRTMLTTTACSLGALSAQATTLDFSELVHGEKVGTQFSASGVTISGVHLSGGPNAVIAFDSLRTGTADPDLEGPEWAAGNLAPSTVLGRMLIIPENVTDKNADGFVDSPNDEGSRPAGRITFDFDSTIQQLGFDLVDIELGGGSREPGFVEFWSGESLLATVGFASFIDAGSAFYDATVVYGDNSANRIQAITAGAIGAQSFDRVVFQLGGSGAIDNVRFEPTVVPESGSLVLLGAALAGLGFLRRRRSA